MSDGNKVDQLIAAAAQHEADSQSSYGCGLTLLLVAAFLAFVVIPLVMGMN
jgi:hypothetical protein